MMERDDDGDAIMAATAVQEQDDDLPDTNIVLEAEELTGL